ncbi:MAG TPA: alpha/beta hydrolase [Chthoniobacterales bacterium]|nr:alpha/beta hydrolase [Chthoniobacterales bacterium]
MCNLIRTLLAVLFACGGLSAQTPAWQPSPGHTQVPIWPKEPPDAQPVAGPESARTVKEKPIAGRPWLEVSNVSQPTMTVYSPKGKNTGAAVVVFPGGGYKVLAIDLEGTEAADWLTSKGITCVLLKYRVPFSGPYWDERRGRVYPAPTALQDAQRTLGLVRHHAAKWKIDPNKIGVLGFSAGGHVAAGISTVFEHRVYPAVDEADKESCRPDFAMILFPGHLWANEDLDPSTIKDEKFELRPDIQVTGRTPPTFLVQAQNDDVDAVEESLAYYIALKRAGVPTEMHLYAEGGHAFALRRTTFPITEWPKLAERWLATIGMISK